MEKQFTYEYYQWGANNKVMDIIDQRDPSVNRKATRNRKTRKPLVQIRQNYKPKSMGHQTTRRTRKTEGGPNPPTTTTNFVQK